MIEIHRSSERGQTKVDWLDSQHSFSFGNYYHPQRKNFGALVVLNEDWIEPGKGFLLHSHRNMEIITIILQGTLEHEDSMENKSIITAGEVQQLTAGTGITHSEFNASPMERVHVLQIWIEPRLRNLPPSYQQKRFLLEKNKLVPLVADTRHKDWLMLQQKARILRGIFEAGQLIAHQPQPGNGVYIFIITGKVECGVPGGKETLNRGDAVAMDEPLKLQSAGESDLVLIEVPIK